MKVEMITYLCLYHLLMDHTVTSSKTLWRR